MYNNAGENRDDRHLVEKVLGGDTHAFAIIIKNTQKLVARIVFDMISNAEERKDIAQDIYLKAWNKLPGFKFQSKLSTWIGQISYNTCIDYLRKKKLVFPDFRFEENDTGEEILDSLNRSAGVSVATADTLVVQKDMTEIVRLGIGKLQPVYKTLITLYHNEELSYEEIGEITGLPPGTVKSYLFRARRELKNILLHHYKKEDLW